jgi:hypothetical protein
MLAALKLVYRYRQLAGRCETGAGLDFDEIGELTAIEASFAGETQRLAGDRRIGERDFSRAPVLLGATLYRRQFRDQVTIFDIGPGGFVCEGAPFLQEGDRVEVVVDGGAESPASYRFMAQVAWTRDRESDCVIGFRFVGIPLEIRRRARPPGNQEAARPPAVPPPAPPPAEPDATQPSPERGAKPSASTEHRVDEVHAAA